MSDKTTNERKQAIYDAAKNFLEVIHENGEPGPSLTHAKRTAVDAKMWAVDTLFPNEFDELINRRN